MTEKGKGEWYPYKCIGHPLASQVYKNWHHYRPTARGVLKSLADRCRVSV